MLALGEATRGHSWIVLKDGVVLEREPRRLVPDGPPKLLLAGLLEILGFDAGRIVRWWDGRVVVIFDTKRYANRVSRLGRNLWKRHLQLV
jgi:hypothetical protein